MLRQALKDQEIANTIKELWRARKNSHSFKTPDGAREISSEDQAYSKLRPEQKIAFDKEQEEWNREKEMNANRMLKT